MTQIETEEKQIDVEEEKTEEVTESVNEEVDVILELKQTIDNHFMNVKNLVRYSKEKDKNVQLLSKQMQIYHDGVEKTLFKRIVMELIPYREDCLKSLRMLETNEINVETTKKYLNFLQDDFVGLCENIGIEEVDGVYLMNGKSLDSKIELHELTDIPELPNVEIEDIPLTDICSLHAYLKNCEQAIVSLLKNNEILDSLLGSYINMASAYEKGLYQVILYPVVRQIIKTKDEMFNRIREKIENLTEENSKSIFQDELTRIIEKCDELLIKCNVSIDSYVPEKYDPKTQRIIKMIETDDNEKEACIVRKYCDCYIMDEKVIYPSKVDVYKFKKID